jgi:hypothetical protein
MTIQANYKKWLALLAVTEISPCSLEQGLSAVRGMAALELAVQGLGAIGTADIRAKLAMALGGAGWPLVASALVDLEAVKIAA